LTLALLLAACSGGESREVPLPADWNLLPAEVRPLIEQAAERCRESPKDAEAFAALGRLYHGNAARALAAASYERALAIRGADAKTLYFLGLIREELGLAEAALDLFTRARDLEPSYAPIRHHRASALLDASRVPEAVEEAREAVRLDPSQVPFRVGLARALRQAGSLEAALGAIDGAVALAPGDVAANQVAALVLKELGRPDAAASRLSGGKAGRSGLVRDPWFEEVLKLSATASGKLSLAEFFLSNGKPGTALEILEPLARAHPKRADIHRTHARALSAKGSLPPVRDALARAVEADPADAQARAELASVLLDLGEVAEGARHAEAAVAADGGLDYARIVRSRAKLAKGDASGALADATSVLARNERDLFGQVLRGDALLALGRPADAAGAFDAALRIDPAFEYAKARLAAARAAAARGPASR
jgi:tetratricopeptide (TPR) repeat protein